MAIVKGSRAVQLIRQDYRYDSQSGAASIEREYHGSVQSAMGFFGRFWGGKDNVSAQIEGGTGRVIVQTPVENVATEQEFSERYEVSVEFVEKEIWQNPAVAAEARRYDDFVETNGQADDPYYRELAEDLARRKVLASVNVVDYPILAQVVRYLRDAVTGYELEYIVIKRTRKISRNGGRVASVGDGLMVYSTDQLQLPRDIAFSVPNSSMQTPISSDYFWGWRRRPSTSSVDGLYIEQSSEFILAQWASLFYTQSTVNASW